MSKPPPARYRTTNWSSYTASLKRRGSLLIWLDKEMTRLAPPDGSPGRPEVFSDAAIQSCLTIKVLFRLPLRQMTGRVASLLKMAGLDWAVPDDTTLCRRQRTLAVQIPYRRADRPLEPARRQHRYQVPGRWRMAGAQARHSGRARSPAGLNRRHRRSDRWRDDGDRPPAHGASSIWPWTRPPPTFGQWNSLPAATATVRSCRTCWTRSPRARTSER